MGIEIPPEWRSSSVPPAGAHPRSVHGIALLSVPRREQLPAELQRRWPFVWITGLDGTGLHNLAARAVKATGIVDKDLRQVALRLIHEWIPISPGSPADLEAEHVLITVLDAATDEQDRRNAAKAAA